jgi:20S proteasome subunit beta 3
MGVIFSRANAVVLISLIRFVNAEGPAGGGAILAMAGNGCVAIAHDRRISSAMLGGQPLIGTNAKRILKVHDGLLLGLSGLDGDVTTFAEDMDASLRLLRIEASETGSTRRISPSSLARLVSTKLYSKRTTSPLYVEPLIAGLVDVRGDGKYIPYLCSQDSLGAPMVAEDFVVCGTCSSSLMGLCEAFYKPGLSPEELWEVVAKCLVGAVDRDCLSGSNTVVHLVTASGITTRELGGRSD